MLGHVRGVVFLLVAAGGAVAAEPVPARVSGPMSQPGTMSVPQAGADSQSIYSYGPSYWMMASPAMTPAEYSLTPGYPRNLGGVAPGALHERYPYYSYRRPWYTPGPASQNVTIVW